MCGERVRVDGELVALKVGLDADRGDRATFGVEQRHLSKERVRPERLNDRPLLADDLDVAGRAKVHALGLLARPDDVVALHEDDALELLRDGAREARHAVLEHLPRREHELAEKVGEGRGGRGDGREIAPAATRARARTCAA